MTIKQLEAQPAHPVARTIGTVVVLSIIIAFLITMFYKIGGAAAQGLDAGVGSAGSAAALPVAALPNLDTDPGGFLQSIFLAVKSGDWTAVAAAALIGVVWLARKPWLLGKVAFFSTDRGGVVLAFGMSVLGGLGTAIAATHSFPTDLATYKAIGMTAVTAMGGYVALKRFIWPADKKADPAPPVLTVAPPAA